MNIKKLNYLGISCALIFFFSIPVRAQKVDGDALTKIVATKMPDAYRNPDGRLVNAKAKRASVGDPIWIVFSDRDQNQTYFDKNCTKPYSKINFMQSFLVAEETDNEIRIVAFDPSSSPIEERKKGEVGFKAGAEDMGWIKKKSMLLWSVALVDDTTKYSKKAISVKKLGKAGELKGLISKGIINLYNYPSAKPEFDNKRDIHLFQYLFILKEDKESGMFLLSKVNRTSTSNANEDVLGWATGDQIHVWDNALCLRINFDDAAIEERKDKKIEVKFFSSPDDARKFRDGAAVVGLPFIYNEPGLNENDNPYYYGFPIIGTVGKDNNVYKTGYVTFTIDKNGNKVFSANKQARFNEIYEGLQKQKENTNIIFVLDGASRNFFKTFQSVINENTLIGNASMTRNNYKLGAVIYNDTKAGEEERFKIIRPTANKEDFMDNLRVQAERPPATPINREVNGAPIYDALKRACNLFPDMNTTNIIIMTGSTTDPDKTLKQEVLNQMITKQAKMYFYQLNNNDGSLYDQYVKDCREFLEKTSEAIDNKYFKEEIAAQKMKKHKLECPDESCYIKNSATPGAFFSKDAGESFKPDEVNKKTKKLLFDIENSLTALLARYDQNTVNAGNASVQINDEERKQLMIMLKQGGITEQDIELLANQENFQLFIEAYTSVINSKLNHHLMTRTLFMNRTEFQRLRDAFEKLNQSNVASSQRSNLVETYKNIILQYKGTIDSRELDNYDLNQFMTLVTSLPNTNNKLFSRSLSDLSNIKKTPDDVIQKLKDNFYRINKKLKDLEKNKLYILEQDDNTFYWVPETVFHIDE